MLHIKVFKLGLARRPQVTPEITPEPQFLAKLSNETKENFYTEWKIIISGEISTNSSLS